MRRNIAVLFTVCMFVNVGMWLERFVIIVTSLHRDFLPSSWEMYYPTIWDFMTLAGTIGLFTTLMFLFVRVLPMISIFEMRTLLPEARAKPPARRRGRTDGARSAATAPLYGLMAEFDSAQALLDAAHKVRAGRLHEDRRLFAVPDSRPGRSARIPRARGRADRPGRRDHRARRRLRPRVLDAGDRVSDEHRRPAVPRLGRRSSRRRSRRRFCSRRSPPCSACWR